MSHFDNKAKNWDTKGKISRSHIVAEMIKKTSTLDNSMRVLDFGCGTGLLTYELIDSVKSIHSIDLSKNMLEELENKNHEKKAITTEFTGIFEVTSKFDLIVSSMVMHHIDDTSKLAQKLYDSINENGTIAIADLVYEDGSFHHSHEGVFYNGFNLEELVEIFSGVGFSDITIVKDIFTIEKNNKKYPLFLIIAKK